MSEQLQINYSFVTIIDRQNYLIYNVNNRIASSLKGVALYEKKS